MKGKFGMIKSDKMASGKEFGMKEWPKMIKGQSKDFGKLPGKRK